MQPRISIVTAVKDEVHNLEGFFTSLGRLPFEVVMIDTGSTDGTLECLYGLQKTLPYPLHIGKFKEDPFHFGKAKNAAVNLATGDYVFVLDADERLSQELLDGLRDFVGRAQPEAVEFPRHDELVPHLRDPQVRLFKNGRGIRYGENEASRVHEKLSVMEVAVFEAPILHIQGQRHWLRNPSRIRQQLFLEVLKTPNTRGFVRECARGVLGFFYKFRKVYRDTYQDGFKGFMYALLKGWYDFLLHIKVGLKPRQKL